MTPDREIDKLCAEKVMGWKRLTFNEWQPDTWEPDHHLHDTLTNEWFDADGKPTGQYVEDHHDYEDSEYGFAPSTDPADSKLLRDKLAETWNYDLGRYGSKPCMFTFKLYRDGCSFDEYGDTEEMAVVNTVKKWLKSKGIEVPCA